MKDSALPHQECTVIGHPFKALGRGQTCRSTFRALRAAMWPAKLRDVYGAVVTDAQLVVELKPYLHKGTSEINVFVLNGDEIEPALKVMGRSSFEHAYNVIYPAWELENYPKEWAQLLNQCDEVWANSRFCYEALKAAVDRPVYHLPEVIAPRLERDYGRRHFGVPESAFAFLFVFDFSSYVQRKNPQAVIEAFRRFCARSPYQDVCFVIKMKGGERWAQEEAELREALRPLRATIIDRLLTDQEMQSLIRCCDCFVSLHRSEGFGLLLGEAMHHRKPVIGTGYSGNRDFMQDDVACLVNYTLVPVAEGAYPHWQGQVWAEPDIDHALWWMNKVVSQQEWARELGQRASRHIRTNFGSRAGGLRFAGRLADIAAGLRESQPAGRSEYAQPPLALSQTK